MARPRFEVTPERRDAVITLAQAGASQAKIAKVIGCTPKTLRKFLAPELAEYFSDRELARKKNKNPVKTRVGITNQHISLLCPKCLALIELTIRDQRSEVRIRTRPTKN